MILPTKHIALRRSMLGVGAALLSHLGKPRTVSSLWNELREHPDVVSYDRFVLALDLLYSVGAIELVDGVLRRRRA
jgi:hypothetical protein